MKYKLFTIISLIIGFLLAVLILEFVLRFFPVRTSLLPQIVDEENPIYRFQPNLTFIYSKGWNFAVINRGRTNNYGFVSDLQYDSQETTPLLAVIGDSFIWAAMVPFKDTLHGRLEKIAQRNNRRVYSFASGGSPLSQYLAYAEYAKSQFKPTAMIFVIIANDFDESLMKYKATPGHHYFKQNEEGDLVLTRVDLRPVKIWQIARYSALLRYLYFNLGVKYVNLPNLSWLKSLFLNQSTLKELEYSKYVGNVSSIANRERVEDSKRVVRAFFDELPERTGLDSGNILFVIDGMRPHIYSEILMRYTAGSYFDLMRKFFIETAQSRGYELIDMQPLFISKYKRDNYRFEWPTDNHWNSLGHALATEAIVTSQVFRRFSQD